jgi:hypothetical protein
VSAAEWEGKIYLSIILKMPFSNFYERLSFSVDSSWRGDDKCELNEEL